MNQFSIAISIAFLFTLAVSLPLDSVSGRQRSEDTAEYGDHFEGDMILNEDQLEALSPTARNGLIADKYHWPNKTVPYQLNEKHPKDRQDLIEKALRTIESISCLKFVRRTNETKFVKITAEGGGCYSSVGYQNGTQNVNLSNDAPGTGCFRIGTIIHEFLHAVGFYHMQSAHDRDDYVTIVWDNIRPGTSHNFNKYSTSQVSHYNTTYDYESLMHYHAYGFSKNGRATIVPKDKNLRKIGQREGLSKKDIWKLNLMYDCDNTIEPQPEL